MFNKSLDAIYKELGSEKAGLSAVEAEKRLIKNGKNLLERDKKKPFIILFLSQFKDAMICILIIAAIISAAAGGLIDSVIIFMVVFCNSLLGAIQESKAEKAIKALQKLSSDKSKVRRGGKIVEILSEDLCVGDIVLLESGDSIPADLRLIETHSLKIEEAALTGESEAVEKHCDIIDSVNLSIGDKKNMAFTGTNVVYGRGEGIVVYCGMQTEMGKIAHILNSTQNEDTPLQKQLNKLGKTLSAVILVICVFIFGINLLRHFIEYKSFDKLNLVDNFLMAISLAVAAIPEGLTAVVTLIMTIGVTKLSKQNAIIRKLPSIETLGCAEIICSDKTGTLTQNKMTVAKIFTATFNQAEIDKLVLTAVLCNNSQISGKKISGDPTETALINYAVDKGVNFNELLAKNKRIGEIPFSSDRKLMTTLNISNTGKITMYVKGAADNILDCCNKILVNDRILPIDYELKTKIKNSINNMAASALRVIGFAVKETTSVKVVENDETELTFIGLTGLKDPIRPEVKEAVNKCKTAGIMPIMITGDHKSTAVAIAKETGIIKSESEAITGSELDRLSDEEFDKILDRYRVYARVSPENKVRIVRHWKKRGKVCAMTGDGVNDAPALKTADIGVGMGITGTDVSKSVADIVLADDNFATIIIAVEEGRKIYSNIKKTVQFLLSSNTCEVLTILIASILGFSILSPIQILYVNLVTDTVPALGLGVENAESDIMELKPRNPKKSLFSEGVGFNIIYQSIFLCTLVLSSYLIAFNNSNAKQAMTCAFATLSLSQIVHSYNLKSINHSVLNKSFFNNRLLNLGSIATVALTFFLIYTPKVNAVFGLEPLSLFNCCMVIMFCLAIIPLVELAKFILNPKKKKPKKALLKA